MSNEHSNFNQPSEQAIALFLQENDGDKLTDILVEALYEAFRIMEDDLNPGTLH
ncbi:Uncharacterised protein [Mycobacterium tuberculosis]|uniref:IS256 family transposase n=1 Tax=Neorhizobium turbinariae TaxID=2937795 RepID=A0ABT0IWU1_9HYPH|nr:MULTISPECIES: hypothetical protein [Neorhizobium]MCK8782352.1 hypothetical protein [Neorhizobium turbinariae]CLQ43773.1 Uncharacterised protein [Mycobacterium tuberculosis]